MSRFHDEFFAQRGPKHDMLMIRAINKDGLKRVVGNVHKSYPTAPVSTKAKIFESCYNHEKMIFWAIRPVESDNIMRELDENGVVIDVSLTENESTNYETEVICRNGGFILGYADILITYEFKVIISGKLDQMTKTDYWHYYKKRILVEVKPEINDVGAVLRQLKTYESILNRDHEVEFEKVIVTSAAPNVDILEYLQHEGVRVVVLDGSL